MKCYIDRNHLNHPHVPHRLFLHVGATITPELLAALDNEYQLTNVGRREKPGGRWVVDHVGIELTPKETTDAD